MSRDGRYTWLEALSSERGPHEIDALRRACEVAATAHEDQKRASGEPYITHPLAVADILQSLRLDVDTLVAAILRDVVEDTPVALNDLTTQFGSQVAGLVDGVTKMGMIDGFHSDGGNRSRHQMQVEAL